MTAALFFGQYEARQTEVEGTMKVSTLRESGRKKVGERENKRNVNSANAKTRKDKKDISAKTTQNAFSYVSCRPFFSICGMTWTILFVSTQEQKDFRDLQRVQRHLGPSLSTSHVFAFLSFLLCLTSLFQYHSV